MTFVDAAARQTIRTDLESTLVVEAAAGTGKTTEMIARLIETIRSGTAGLEQIVALTFTDKAAGEMKLRLRVELEKARGEMPGRTTSAVGRERSRFERALAELEVARIGTIHSFCADLLRERPIEARVDPLFEVAGEDEADRMFQQAFDGWLQRTLADPGDGVRRILRREGPVDQLRSAGRALINRRDFDGEWRRDPFDRAAGIQTVLDELATLAAFASRAQSATDPLAKLCARLANWLGDLARREALRPRDLDGLEAELATVARWWEWRYSGRNKQYGDGLPRAEVVAIRDHVIAAIAAFRQAADADLAACLHDELRPLVVAYTGLGARSGRLDFFDLLERARDVLRDDPSVRRDYQQRFTRFFVDEFQDTDPLQVEILMLLCADDPACTDAAHARIKPGKLFVVGDPKQAIYRFRRADVALYEQVKRRLLGDGAKLVELTTSFRAVPGLQAAINAAFEPVMRGDGQARYVPLSPERTDVANRPSVIALPVPEPYGKRDVTNKAIEESYPHAVGAFLDWLLHKSGWTLLTAGGPRPITTRDVCLMFRRFQNFGSDLTRPYVTALEARQIPHVLVGGRSFHEREEAIAIRAALSAIEWPDDELSVYATLRGPLFAFHDEDLVAFKHGYGPLYPLGYLAGAPLVPRSPQAAVPATSEPGSPESSAERFREIADSLALLGELNSERNRRPIADTLGRLLAATRAHAGFAMWPAGEQALANVLRVLDLARKFEARSSIATSFRAFVERLADDAERSRQPDAMVVEEGTEGVRIMTAHAAKGLEFPVVILCDPTAQLAQHNPSRYVDSTRRLWLEPLAGCVPSELRERAEEVLQRDREEGQRLAYVAVTRAKDILVMPVVGDEERDSWLSALVPVTHPDPARKRSPVGAAGCPPFGTDSVRSRGPDVDRFGADSVSPGRHQPRAGTTPVVWWDPHVLDLDRHVGGGMRQRQVLQADESGERAGASEDAHRRWQERRAKAIVDGSRASLDVKTITEASKEANAGWDPVAIEDTGVDRSSRPRGKRFGVLVHAVLAGIPLDAGAVAIATLAQSHGRLVGATREEIDAAATAVAAALRHPLLLRARAADKLRREAPVVLSTDVGMLEGIVDLAFAEGEVWTVVDYKTDAELGEGVAFLQQSYEMQVRMYAAAIGAATGQPAHPTLLIV
jgi:ATP-dependent helicase/nuclease subunit A